MKKIIWGLLFVFGIVGCSNNTVPAKSEGTGIVGHWYYDLKKSEKFAKDAYTKSVMRSLVGEEAHFDAKGNFIDKGKVIGSWKKEKNHYSITYSGDRTMEAKRDGIYLLIVQKGMPMYFRTQNSDVNTKKLSDYVHLNTPYRQKTRIYDNGYLYYLFLDNGVMYSCVSKEKQLSAKEILTKGDKFRYKYSNDMIHIKGLLTISVKAKTKDHLKTSQDDELMVQR